MARITPDLMKDIFTEEVVEILPSNRNIKKGVANLKKSQDPNVRIRQKKGAQARSSKESYRKKLQDSSNRELARENSNELHQQEWFRSKFLKGVKDRLNDPERYQAWRNNVEAKRENTTRAKYKPMQTPDGVFKSLRDAAAHYCIHVSSMRDRMKHNKNKYYYISKEQYIELTGLNPWSD